MQKYKYNFLCDDITPRRFNAMDTKKQAKATRILHLIAFA